MNISFRKRRINKDLFYLEGEGPYLFRDLYKILKNYILANDLGLFVLKADLSERIVTTVFRHQLDVQLIPYHFINQKFIWIESFNISLIFSKTDFGSSMDLGAFTNDPSFFQLKKKRNLFERFMCGFKSQHSENIEISKLFGKNDFLLSTIEMPFFRLYTKNEEVIDLVITSISQCQFDN